MFIISSWNLTVDASQCSQEKCSPYANKRRVPVAFWSASPESSAGHDSVVCQHVGSGLTAWVQILDTPLFALCPRKIFALIFILNWSSVDS